MSKLDGLYNQLEALIDSALSMEEDDPKKKEILITVATSPETDPEVNSLLIKISKELGIDSSKIINWYKGCSKQPKPITCLKQKVQRYKARYRLD